MTKVIQAPTLDDALLALSRRVQENESRGEQTIVFCEDKLTLLAERAVLAGKGENAGTFLTEVSTFARYLSGNAAVLSKEGSVMEIENLLLSHAEELGCFGKGSARAVYETIAQLSASRVDAALLRAGAEESDGMLRIKLLDLALLLEKYGEFLRANGLVDESGYLALLPEKLSSGELRGVNVVFFAFTSFTRQAAEGVRAAMECAKSVEGIFLGGSEGVYTNEAVNIFRRIAEECGGSKLYPMPSTLEGDAELLRKGLFSPERFLSGCKKSEQVRVFEASDEAEELDRVASLIKKYTAEGMRYCELAVLVPDDSYFPVAEKAFAAYKIPMFADKKRTLAEHPFCTFMLAVLNAVHDGVLPDEADDIAASVYFGRGDNYRNYLLKYGGFRGAVRREIKEGDAVKGYDRDELVACREKMLSILALFPRTGKGAAFAAGIRKLYELVEGERVTEKLSAAFSGAEREFLDISRLEGVLSETETVSGGRSFTAREFAVLLESGLKAVSVAMIPQYADAVFVGDATESRIRRARVLFCVGLTDALPRVSADTAVITDGEIGKLSRLKVEIEPAIAQVNARARESLAMNLTAFTEALYLSCPTRRAGAETAKSEALAYVSKLLISAPIPAIFPYDCSESGPAALRYLMMAQDYHAGRSCERDEGEALRAALQETGEWETLSRLQSDEKAPVYQAAELWFGGDVSPTLLESYFECPYAGFVSRALRVREREERTVLDTDAGTFVHAVLEKVAPAFNTLENEEACRSLAERECRTLLESPRFSALADTAAGKYTAERLIGEGVEVAAAAYRQINASAFRVRETEGHISIPALQISGKTDRVDESDGLVRVIDYKTGTIDDKPISYYTGRKLQLQLYLRAAAEGGRAVGAFYFPAASEFTEEGERKFCMKGFYCSDEDVTRRMDTTLQTGKSNFFDGSIGGRALDKGMTQESFEYFLDYALLVSARAEEEMRAGNVLPSPYEGACNYCKYRGMCGFDGTPRKEQSVKCAEIAKIVRRERGKEC